jgi:ribosomal protein L23
MKPWVKLIIGEVIFIVALFASMRTLGLSVEVLFSTDVVKVSVFNQQDDMWWVKHSSKYGFSKGYIDHASCPPALDSQP